MKSESPSKLFIGPGWFKTPGNLWRVYLNPCTNSYDRSCRVGKTRSECVGKRAKKIVRRYLASQKGT